MHRELAVQDAPLRSAAVLPCGEAIVCSAQPVPFHRSASPLPVAVHPPAEVQETASSWLTEEAVFGVDWTAQLDPFQTSASVAELGPVEESPTASHTDAEGQDTPLSTLFAALPTLGVDWMVQLGPPQPSPSGCVAPPLVNFPTASQASSCCHDTPLSSRHA